MSALKSSRLLTSTALPFLYPCLDSSWIAGPTIRNRNTKRRPHSTLIIQHRHQSTIAFPSPTPPSPEPDFPPVDITRYDHLTPEPPDFTSQNFTDSCLITLQAGSGGHGCISFLREKYIPNGPPDGGDGGTGGNVYIQAVTGETSLHKLARRPILKAERGKNGQGSGKGGKRGEDVVIQVPVGTVVREIARVDPVEEDLKMGKGRGFGRDLEDDVVEEGATDQQRKWRREKWLLYPGELPKSFTHADFPALPRPRRSNLVASQPPAPLRLDLDKAMATPMLLAAGAMGGLGNPHFVTKSIPRPKYATKGDGGARIQVHLELKILADVGLVGLPNAGKSTLLRALTRSRTKVGSWAFTTLSPNIGTVVLDDYKGRPDVAANIYLKSQNRTHFTIADIPGLIEDAHLDRGLGLGFLRHIERAAVLAFVLDLSAGDAVAALKSLWREVGEYEKLRDGEVNEETERQAPHEDGLVDFRPFESSISPGFEPEPSSETMTDEPTNLLLDRQAGRRLPLLTLPPVTTKSWFVVATKADLDGTQENFAALQNYLMAVQAGAEPHPSGKKNAWRRDLQAVPVSALRKEGVEGIPNLVLSLLDG